MRKQLVEFLFGPGAKSLDLERPDLGERIIRMFEEADEAEREMMAIDKKPLTSILKKLGVTAEVQECPGGAEILFQDGTEYRDAFLAIFTPDAMHDLAEAGWVATRGGDAGMANELPDFKIGFFEIDVAAEDADNGDKAPDLEKVMKDARKDGSTEMKRDDDDLNPIENPDAEMGERREGVGEPSDGKDPEGKPKGSNHESRRTQGRTGRDIQERRQAQAIADRLLETTTTSGVPPVSEPPLAVMRPPQDRPGRLKKRLKPNR